MSVSPVSHTTGRALIYGCMGLGGRWDDNDVTAGEIDEAQRCIEAAVAAGITRFDHADIYALGKAEAAFGKALKRLPGLRDALTIQSKCGIRFADAHGPKRYDLSREWIRRSVENSLRRLETDRLDVLLLHRPDPLMAPSEIAEVFSRLAGEGKVVAFGVSNMYPHQIDFLARALDEPLVINQMEISLLAHSAFEEGVYAGHDDGARHHFGPGLLEHAMNRGIELQAWGSLCQGWLSGRALGDAKPSVRRTAAVVETLAERYDTTRECIVLAWLMRHPAAIRPVIGTTDAGRIAACAGAETVALSHADWYRLYETARGAELP